MIYTTSSILLPTRVMPFNANIFFAQEITWGMRLSSFKKRALGEEDQVNGKSGSPITFLSLSTIPKTPVNGETLANSPQDRDKSS